MDASPPFQLFDQESKEWIDRHVAWVVNTLGRPEVLARTVLTTSSEYFPTQFDGDPEGAEEVLDLLCQHLSLAPMPAHFEDDPREVHDQSPLDAEQVWVETGLLREPANLLCTMTKEVAKVHLARIGARYHLDAYDEATELTAVFMGCGVLLSNGALMDRTESHGLNSAWNMRRLTTLNLVQLGYAMAIFAYLRNEDRPDWVRNLRADVKDAFHRAQSYLEVAGPPDLRMTDPPEACDDQLPQPNSDLAEPPPRQVCIYCGELTFDVAEEQAICKLCLASIQENDQELAEERATKGNAWTGLWQVGVFLFVLALLCVLVSIIDMVF